MRGICRALYDCPDQRLDESGPLVRVIVATHPAPTTKKKKRQVGLIRDGVVYELFWTKLPQSAFTASDVVSLYLHRGSFETALEDEVAIRPGAGSLADRGSVELEPAIGVGAQACRLSRCGPPSLRLPEERRTSTHPRTQPHLLPLHPPRGMLRLPPRPASESWPPHRSRLSPPTGWNPAVSGRQRVGPA